MTKNFVQIGRKEIGSQAQASPLVFAEHPLARLIDPDPEGTTIVHLDKNEPFFLEGDEADTMGIVVRGRIADRRIDKGSGREFTSSLAGRGNLIGMSAFLPKRKHFSTMIAETKSSVLPIPTEKVYQLMSKNFTVRVPEDEEHLEEAERFIDTSFLQALDEANLTEDIMRDKNFGGLKRRTGLAVWKYGPYAIPVETRDGSVQWNLSAVATQEELAQAAGTTQRVLFDKPTEKTKGGGIQYLIRKDIIADGPRGIEIVNPAKLERYALTGEI